MKDTIRLNTQLYKNKNKSTYKLQPYIDIFCIYSMYLFRRGNEAQYAIFNWASWNSSCENIEASQLELGKKEEEENDDDEKK